MLVTLVPSRKRLWRVVPCLTKRLQLLKGLQISADIGNAAIEVRHPFSRSFSSYLHMEEKSSFILFFFFLIEHIH